MAEYYVVQSFKKVKGGMLPNPPFQARDVTHARRVAEQQATKFAAVVAFMREGDLSTGEYSDPKLLSAFGEVPEELLDMEKLV